MSSQFRLVTANISKLHLAAFKLPAALQHSGFELVENGTVSRPPAQNAINSSFYLCPICLLVARDPIVVSCCKHWYCCGCYMAYLASVGPKNCAVCRSTNFTTNNKTPFARSILYGTLQVKCRYACNTTGKITDIEKHEIFDCNQREIQCPCPSCPENGKAADILVHLPNCQYLTQYCLNCNLPVQLKKANEHNCITELKRAVVNMEKRLTDLNQPLFIESKSGKGGDAVFRAPPTKKGMPMEEYCKKFRQSPPIKRHLDQSGPPERGNPRQWRPEDLFGNKRPKILIRPASRREQVANRRVIDLTDTRPVDHQNF